MWISQLSSSGLLPRFTCSVSLLPPLSPLPSSVLSFLPSSLPLAGGSAEVGASVVGLRCSLSWAGGGEERGWRGRKERKGEEKETRGLRPREGKGKQTRVFTQVKKTKRQQLCPSPLFSTPPPSSLALPLFPSHSFSPGRGLAGLGLDAICCIM